MNSFVGNLICEEYENNLPPELEESMPFEIMALNPERILLEKLDAILNLQSKNRLQWGTRHFFDIYNLLTLDCVKSLTKEQINLIQAGNFIWGKSQGLWFQISWINLGEHLNYLTIGPSKVILISQTRRVNLVVFCLMVLVVTEYLL